MSSRYLVLSGSAGRWSGSVRRLDDSREQVSERGEIIQGHCDPSPHHFFIVDPAVEKVGGFWSGMGESQGGKVAMWMNKKTSVAKDFRDAIGVHHRWLLGLLRLLGLARHDFSPGSVGANQDSDGWDGRHCSSQSPSL
jgi:hypothetical protein